jgi:Glycosyltransferase family 9 (heptosyltransferase)
VNASVPEPLIVLDKALQTYRKIVDQPKTFGLAYPLFYSATRCNVDGQFVRALAAFDEALALGLDHADLHHNRGSALFNLGHHAQGLASLERALQMADASNAATIFNTHGFMLQHMARWQEAKQSYLHALQHDPYNTLAQLNLGLVCLTLGEWETGWKGYEARWSGAREATSGQYIRPDCHLAYWTGQPVQPGDALLVFAEQGFGDTLMCCRYLLLAAGHFSRVSLVCPPSLISLLRHSLGPTVEVLGSVVKNHSVWQWHTSLMSLPLAFQTRVHSVPNQVPYLKAAPEKAARWGEKLRQHIPQKVFKVGVAWAGAPGLAIDAKRSMALEQLAPLFAMQGVKWVSLQKSQLASAALLDFSAEITDFDETAALISQLDLVITVDTAVVHLAGAMGKPVWLLNRFETEWRWLLDRTDSPWYPTVRIFRQAQPDVWTDVIIQVQQALGQLLGQSFPS